MSDLLNARCRCPEFYTGREKPPPCPVHLEPRDVR